MNSEYQVGAVADIIARLSKKKHIMNSTETSDVSTPTKTKKGKKRKLSESNTELENGIVHKNSNKTKSIKVKLCKEQKIVNADNVEAEKKILTIKDTKKKKIKFAKNIVKSKTEEDSLKISKNNMKIKTKKQIQSSSQKKDHTETVEKSSNLREITKKNKKQLKKKIKGKPGKKVKAQDVSQIDADTTDINKESSTGKKKKGKKLKDNIDLESNTISGSVEDMLQETTEAKPDGQTEHKGFPKHVENISDQENEKPEIDEEEESRTIFVGNLPLKITRSRVTNMFKPYGEVETVRFRSVPVADIKLPRKACVKMNKIHEKRTNMNAYVRFKNTESIEKALEMNGHVINEHTIRVDAAQKKAKTNSHAIFIGNLPFEAEEEELRKAFEDCGEIDNVRVIRDQHTNIGKGFAYVNFKSSDSVAFALELENVKIRNREVRIKRSFDKNRPGNGFGRFNSSKPISGGFQGNQKRFNKEGPSYRGSRGGFERNNRAFGTGSSKFGGQRVAKGGGKRDFGARKLPGGFKDRSEGGYQGRQNGGFKKGRQNGGFKDRQSGGFKGGRFNKKDTSGGDIKRNFRGSTVEEKGNRNNQKKKKLNYDVLKKFIIAKKLTGGSDKKKGFSFLSAS